MIYDNMISDFMNCVFLDPQKKLGGLDGERKLDDVHLIFVKLLSGTPIKGRGTKLDPLFLKIGFTDINHELATLSTEELQGITTHLKPFDGIIGSWTLVHDMPATEVCPQWRLSAEINPRNIQSVSIEETEEEKPRKILCVDFEGVGIFMGKPKNKEIDKEKNKKEN